MKKDMTLHTMAKRLILNSSSQKGTLKAMLLLVMMVIGATGRGEKIFRERIIYEVKVLIKI